MPRLDGVDEGFAVEFSRCGRAIAGDDASADRVRRRGRGTRRQDAGDKRDSVRTRPVVDRTVLLASRMADRYKGGR